MKNITSKEADDFERNSKKQVEIEKGLKELYKIKKPTEQNKKEAEKLRKEGEYISQWFKKTE